MAISYSSDEQKTTKLFLNSGIKITNYQYDSGFINTGTWSGGSINGGSYSTGVTLTEEDYIDIGVVDDEREEITLGGISYSLPGSGVNNRIFWGIGGKILRITITGLIYDGSYVAISSLSKFNGMSNVSVFKYKMIKLLGYQTIIGAVSASTFFPNVVQYRRRGIYEKYLPSAPTYSATETHLAKWMIVGYSGGYVSGTRNYRWTLTLDLSNNNTNGLDNDTTGIYPKPFGEM